ncbi:MAG: DUF4136 domain-containing protein [Gammaproteobacteria bacterium]
MRRGLILASSSALLAIIALLAGCATSGPTIIANANPATDFSNFRTFNFMQPLSTDREGGARTPLSSMLIDSMTLEMKGRGFRQSDSPDLLVDFFIVTEDRLDVRTTPTTATSMSMRRHPHSRHSMSVWSGHQTTVRQYTVGTLGIDIVDRANNALAWEGAAQGRVREDVRNMSQGDIDELTRQIMGQFMHGAN